MTTHPGAGDAAPPPFAGHGDADDGGRPGDRRRGDGGGRRRGRRAPMFTPIEVEHIDYKDVDKLRRLISERGRIESRRKSSLTAKDQRKLAREIKRARFLALLPYTAEHMRVASSYRQAARAARAMEARPPSEVGAPAGPTPTASAPTEPGRAEPAPADTAPAEPAPVSAPAAEARPDESA